MTLGEKKTKFTKMIALLILYADSIGYEIRFAPEHCDHIKNSLHYSGLAKDFDLFKDGEYLTRTVDHEQLGAFWESLGGDWGGNFGDGNHYSLEHAGMK